MRGIEPPTSWSQTKRSADELHPVKVDLPTSRQVMTPTQCQLIITVVCWWWDSNPQGLRPLDFKSNVYTIPPHQQAHNILPNLSSISK